MALNEVKLNDVTVNGGFWKDYIELIREKTIPFQYRAINNDLSVKLGNENRNGSFADEKSNALENLRIAAGLSEGGHYGCIFQDSDVYKWLEAASYSLAIHPDANLQALADGVVELIAKAQEDDGYIDTYFQIKEPALKYRMLCYSHELYCMGHLLEAVVASYEASGNETILAVGERIIDNLDASFGYEEGKLHGAGGHEEVEIGLLRMYELTGDSRALKLADFFLSVRGEDPDFYSKQMEELRGKNAGERYFSIAKDLKYLQCYARPKDQTKAEGHAVRMMYLASAMARLVRHTDDPELKRASDAIWENVTEKKMFVTGGVGSADIGEAFTGDFDLPNDTMYCETCASIALMFFAYEKFKLEQKADYIDVLERALYNGVLSGASRDGIHFFYVNPLEVHADIVDENPGLGHVQYVRPEWYSCACCPPNFARAIGSMQRYIYLVDTEKNEIYVNLTVNSELRCENGVSIVQRTCFPAKNSAAYTVCGNGERLRIRIRIPYWMSNVRATLDGVSIEPENGFLSIEKEFTRSELGLVFDTPVMAVTASPSVVADSGRAAVQRGPFVYCAESVDNEFPLSEYRVSPASIKDASTVEGVGSGVPGLAVAAEREISRSSGLYRFDEPICREKATLRLIPYYSWANRGAREMMVWLLRA